MGGDGKLRRWVAGTAYIWIGGPRVDAFGVSSLAMAAGFMRNLLPILAVLAAIVLLWQLAVAPMNIRTALDQVERAGAVVVPDSSVARRG